MGHLNHSTDRCASKLEDTVPVMIERALTTVVTPFRELIDGIVSRTEVCERGHRATHEVTVLKAAIAELRRDVDQLKSTNMSMIFGTVEIPDDLDIDIPACSDVPPATTGDEVRADDAAAESEAETDDDQLGVQEETVFEGLTEVDEAMVHAVQTSLRDTFMAGSRAAIVDETSGTDV